MFHCRSLRQPCLFFLSCHLKCGLKAFILFIYGHIYTYIIYIVQIVKEIVDGQNIKYNAHKYIYKSNLVIC